MKYWVFGCYELFGYHAAPMRVHRQVEAPVFFAPSVKATSDVSVVN